MVFMKFFADIAHLYVCLCANLHAEHNLQLMVELSPIIDVRNQKASF